MNGKGDGLPPIVIRRGAEYVVLNIDLEPLFPAQKAAVGVVVWDQVKTLMEANGESTVSPASVDRRAAEAVGVGYTGVEVMRRIHKRDPKQLFRVLSGEVTIAEAARSIGMKHSRPPISKNVDSKHFRRGDKFDEGVEPLRRYLQPWKEKNFKFGHVPPKEARRRLPILAQLVADLQEAIADLEMRSHSATTRAPAEK